MAALKKVVEEAGINNVDLCKICYETMDQMGEDFYKCKMCTIIRKKGNGLSNLTSHIEQKHMDIIKDFLSKQKSASRGPINDYLRNISKDAKEYHDWIEWIVMADLPFMFVENKYTRKNSSLGSIGKALLMEYMEAVS